MSGTYNSASVPADYFVNITPGVISAPATGIVMAELMLTNSPRIPIGSIVNFPNLTAVDNYFGATSNEAVEAGVYFNGWDGSTQKPSSLLMAQYPTANVGAFLRGGNISGETLTQLQSINASLTLTIDGTAHNQTVNLSAVTSFTNAGQVINNDFGLSGPNVGTVTADLGATFTGTGSGTTLTVASLTGTIHPGTTASAAISGTGVPANTYIVSQLTGTPGSTGTYQTNNSTTSSAASITCDSDVLDVTAVASGTVTVGQLLSGAGLTTGTYVTALGTGTGGTGSYITTQTQQVASESIVLTNPVVSYDTIAGAFNVISSTTGTLSTMAFATGPAAPLLDLTQATGAVLSQGAAAAVPATFMAGIVAQNPNFATFQTTFDPDNGSGNTQKLAFAAWVNSQNNAYGYIMQDTDITPTESTTATTSAGYILTQANEGPVIPISQPAAGYHLAAFAGGYAASINWNAANGRASLAYKSQGGLLPSVTSESALVNLQANGYNAYVAAATRGAGWNFMFPGSCTGVFKWYDSWLNNVWLNNQVLIALMTLFTTINSVPFDPQGAAILRATIAGAANPPIVPPAFSPVAQALYNGIIDTNVALSAGQQQAVINLVGQTNGPAAIQSLATNGWYLFIPVPTAASRGARIWPGVILLYCDGGSVNQIDISSLAIQ